MSAFCQSTEVDHAGAMGEEETADQMGSPERDIEVTDQPREVAMRQILDPESEESQCKVWAKRGQIGERPGQRRGTYRGSRCRRRRRVSSP